MAYWYTYPCSDSDDSDPDSSIPFTDAEWFKSVKKMDRIVASEAEFFHALGHSRFWAFHRHIIPQTKYWKNPTSQYPLYHLMDYLDDETMRLVQIGIPEFKNDFENELIPLARGEGKMKLDKVELSTLFYYAIRWVEMNRLGRNNYLNDVCWVAMKIIAFQYNDEYGGNYL